MPAPPAPRDKAALHPASRLAQVERLLRRLVPALLFSGVLVQCLRPLRSPLSWMVYAQDDFFYYLKIAQNFAQGHGSTSNGIVATNGYHPLWLLVLAAMSWCSTSPRAILGFLAVTNLLAAVATYFSALRLLTAAGIRTLTALGLATLLTVYALRLFYYGMEVTLAIPLVFAVLCVIENTAFWQRGLLQSCLLGLLVSAMILARLDTTLLACLILGFALLQPGVRSRVRQPQLLGILLGLLPVGAYFLANHVVFDTWLPVSGMAKQLKTNSYPTWRTWQGLYLTLPSFLIVFLPIPLGLLAYPFVARRLRSIQRAIYPAALLFPLAYYFLLCCRSDWSLWGWYMYALRPAVLVGMIVLCLSKPLGRALQSEIVGGVLIVGALAAVAGTPWRIQEPSINDAALDIQQFSRSHPGIYAMGDRSGRVGYLLGDPLIQTEGLVMDRAFLENIRRQRPLREVLADYHVRYYIATTFHPYEGCFEAVEPIQAGPASPHMRGEFCEKPAAIFSHEGIQNLIFDLQPQPGR